MTPNRRRVLIGAAALAGVPGASRAAAFEHRGYRIDTTAIDVASRPDLVASLRAQVDIVAGLGIDPEIKVWFSTVPLSIDPSLDQPGRYRDRRIALRDEAWPSDNPVLLHELMHAFMDQRLPRGGMLRGFFDQARTSGDWPGDSYMLSNLAEFFAMTASVTLWGRSAREPRTRAGLQAAMPDYVAWLDRLFGRIG